MGAQPRYQYPKTIYTTPGGYWCVKPLGYKRNFTTAIVGVAVTLGIAFIIGSRIERRPLTGHPCAPIPPTQHVNKYREVDDPYYSTKVANKQ
ncbi:hypothetical protein DICPUDRAFT_159278 [Dictyostelium purpureum]|uniref:Uncharacterized protein n=1 Tax=Dictyostelium purpureum TaxID=5786 RepID=F1A3Q6_DICPU|nr:uncharacterized protein DICPUDRAFT_159278 [Dictyostelium purpureum]EGC29175.1 hypothetical protein DICPUDRAFT_159278 [Dictyostelium purpureum]|eukprot:XP_003294297.1 hypothetical protein DICPUDRAFT_159278 [Dictyostelium purpureum]